MAQERDVGDRGDHAGREGRGHKRKSAALARAADGDPRAVDDRQAPGRLHGEHRVGHEPPVVVGRGVEDSPRHHARVLRPDAGRRDVRRVAGSPAAPLTARVHHEVRVARRRPDQPVDRSSPSAAVADVLDDRRQRAGRARGVKEPRLDRLAVEPGEGDVGRLDRLQVRLHLDDDGGQPLRAAVGERRRPERVEVRGLVQRRPVRAELVEREVDQGHPRIVAAPGGAGEPRAAAAGRCQSPERAAASIASTLSSRRWWRGSPRERRGQERDGALDGGLDADDPGPERQDVHVVVLHALVRRVRVVADRRPDPADLVGRDGRADARAADQDAAVRAPVHARPRPARWAKSG